MDSSQNLQNISSTTPSQPVSNPSRSREKPQLSCNLCRRRKARCDRKRPCSTCSTRGQACTWPENSSTVVGPPRRAPIASLSMRDRLVQLERLVMSVIASSDAAINTHDKTHGKVRQLAPVPADTMPEDTPIDERSECGSMRISASELRYVGEDHWVAILDGIADLKDHVDWEEQLRLADSPGHALDDVEDRIEDPNPRSRDGAFLLYARCPPTSRNDILSALPPRYAVDRYISRYFNYLDLPLSMDLLSYARSQYEAFWADPSTVSIIWVGLLFSMICLACLAAHQPGNPDAEIQILHINLYREKTVQCLIMGEYTKSGPYVLETVINYIYAEFCISTDANRDIWFLLAIEVNLAIRMGYHRDPGHFPGISPFQGEMRRRVWATVLMSDIMISNQMGLPRMISDWRCDTAEPRNLYDADFDEDTEELPPSRPETELTSALGIIARRRMLKALGIVADLTNRVKSCCYEEVMEVDRILHDAAASVPTSLQWKTMAASITDSPQIIMSRLFIRHMLFKGQIMLHWRFLCVQSPSDKEDGFNYSRQVCIDASIGTLEIQNVLDEETCVGGQLHAMRWRVTSMMNHQFLTATMILCSLLHNGRIVERKDEVRRALQHARAVWIRSSSTSKEAKRAADTIGIVLSRTGVVASNDQMIIADGNGRLIIPDSNCSLGLESNNTIPNNIDFHHGILGSFHPSVLQDQDMNYDVNSAGFRNEWMFINWENPERYPS